MTKLNAKAVHHFRTSGQSLRSQCCQLFQIPYSEILGCVLPMSGGVSGDATGTVLGEVRSGDGWESRGTQYILLSTNSDGTNSDVPDWDT